MLLFPLPVDVCCIRDEVSSRLRLIATVRQADDMPKTPTAQ
jgi:hypothetical protein